MRDPPGRKKRPTINAFSQPYNFTAMQRNYNAEAFNRLSGLLPNVQRDVKKIARDFGKDADGGNPAEARRLALAYFELLEIEIQQAKKAAEAMTFD